MNRCDCAGHLECGGELYRYKGIHRCWKHVVLQTAWWETESVHFDFFDWLDDIGEETAGAILEEMKDLPLRNWKLERPD